MATGDTLVPEEAGVGAPRQSSGLAGPWLAAGLGLAVLTAVPNNGATGPAGAAAPSQVAATAVGSTMSLGGSVPPLRLGTAPTATGTPSFTSSVELTLLASDIQSEPSPPTAALAHEFSTPPAEPAVWASRSFGVAAPSPEVSTPPTAEQWAALRFCESSNDYGAVNASGKYRGAYQFDQPTWESVGGTGDPAAASPQEQDLRARLLFEQRGSSPWPFCGKHLTNHAS